MHQRAVNFRLTITAGGSITRLWKSYKLYISLKGRTKRRHLEVFCLFSRLFYQYLSKFLVCSMMSSREQFVALCTVCLCVLCHDLPSILARTPWKIGPLFLVKQMLIGNDFLHVTM